MITLCVLCLLLTYLNLNLSLKKLFRIFVPSSYFLSMLLIIFLQWKQFLRGRHVMFTVLVNLKRRCSRSIIVLERSAFKRNLRFPTFAWNEIIKENPTVWRQLQVTTCSAMRRIFNSEKFPEILLLCLWGHYSRSNDLENETKIKV